LVSRGQKRIDKYEKRRAKLIALHNDMCHDCRFRHPPHIYEFHHRNPGDKSFELAGAKLNQRWEKVMIEASKCDMLCANCHKVRHYVEREARKSNSKEHKGSNG
jgi:hypothetical protein